MKTKIFCTICKFNGEKMTHWSYSSQDYTVLGIKGTNFVLWVILLAFTIFTASWILGGVIIMLYTCIVFIAKKTQTRIQDVLPLMINRYIGKKRKSKPFIDYRETFLEHDR